jgi:hypothetical protein
MTSAATCHQDKSSSPRSIQLLWNSNRCANFQNCRLFHQVAIWWLNKGNTRRGICPPSGTLSVGVWTIRFKEKWNMLKIDDPQCGTKKSDQSTGVCQIIDGNQIQDGCHVGWAAELMMEKNLPLIIPNKPHKHRMNRPRHLSSNWRKPNPRWKPCSGHLGCVAEVILKRNLPPVTHNKPPKKIGLVDPGVGQKIDGNQIQDGGRSGHLGWAVEQIIERNLPLVIPNKPQTNWINRPKRLSSNRRKPNPTKSPLSKHSPEICSWKRPLSREKWYVHVTPKPYRMCGGSGGKCLFGLFTQKKHL